jgi:hypothetical protein
MIVKYDRKTFIVQATAETPLLNNDRKKHAKNFFTDVTVAVS